jgi:hypothetical protein
VRVTFIFKRPWRVAKTTYTNEASPFAHTIRSETMTETSSSAASTATGTPTQRVVITATTSNHHRHHGDADERTRPPPAPHPAKIVMGKAHVARDLSIFFILLAVALYTSFGLPYGKDKSKLLLGQDGVKKPTNVKKESLMTSTIKTIMETRYRSKECAFFLHNGRIPRAGLSLFAGRDFGSGDILLTHLPTTAATTATTATTDGDDGSLFPLLAHLVKPHPTLANVQFIRIQDDDKNDTSGDSSSYSYSLRATTAIPAGSELFQSVMMTTDNELGVYHYDYLYGRTVPSEHEYQIAYDIAQELLPYENLPDSKWQRNSRHRQPHFMTIQKHVRSALLKVNGRIAHLLSQAPGDPSLPIAEVLLRRPPLKQIARAGSCVEESPHHVNAYQVGEVVAQIPLHLIGRGAKCSTVSYGSSQYCGIVSSIAFVVAAAEDQGMNSQHPPNGLANIKFQWKADTDDHRPILQAIATREIPPRTMVRMMMALIVVVVIVELGTRRK